MFTKKTFAPSAGFGFNDYIICFAWFLGIAFAVSLVFKVGGWCWLFFLSALYVFCSNSGLGNTTAHHIHGILEFDPLLCFLTYPFGAGEGSLL